MRKRIVIKLSGKVFDADRAGTLKDYASLLLRISKIRQPIIVAGGGSIARHYINNARSSGADESTLDEMGIEISRLNARLLICALGDKAYPHPPTTLQEIKQAADGGLVVVAGGLYPGQSTNGTAALVAERVGAAEFLNATDVDGVYDMDPNKHKEAKMLGRIELGRLQEMLVQEGAVAGGHDLMDTVSLKTIERSRIRTRIVGADIKTLEKAIRSSAVGTTIVLPGDS